MSYDLPYVTIAIPFFNPGCAFRNSIRSVFAQTHQKWELILIDDGSSDGSLEFASSIHDERVRVVSDGKNKRLAARLNEVAQIANYDYIARMDADDMMHPSRIEKQLQFLIDNPKIDLVSSGVYSLTNSNLPIGSRCVGVDHQITAKSLLDGNCGILNAAVVARREWFLRNPFKEELRRAQDANLWLQAYSRNDLKVKVLCDPLYFYREEDNVSEDRILEAYKVMRDTIRVESRTGFSKFDRVVAYLKNLVKSFIVWSAVRTGSMNFIRRRRIAKLLSERESCEVVGLIRHIQNTNIPIY